MTKNAYFIIGLVLILIIAGFVFVKQKGGNEALAPTNEETANQSPTLTPAPLTSQTPSSKIVTYTASGFTPVSVTIKAGDAITFKNNSGVDFWPASGPHPTHTNYPEFDAKQGIASGATYSFTFTRVGSWKYHNHLNPASTVTITFQ